MKIAIVVIAFNRQVSLSRLLNSLNQAEVDCDVDLIISLEGNSTKEVCELAENFSSTKFKKILLKRQVQMGLRNHVIACGDIVNDYDGIIILEDDLLLDKYFFKYAKASLQFYSKNKNIAGVALYSPDYNEFANLPFRPMYNGYDNFPAQLACSWGQCWTREQWYGFKNWYNEDKIDKLTNIIGLPDQVKDWPESSWKKYYHGYMVERDLYFIYPYISYSTNCSDAGGTHILNESNLHQVCLPAQNRPLPEFRFCPANYTEVSYDAFLEPNGDYVFRQLSMPKEKVAVDTLMIKPKSLLNTYKFVLTTRQTKEQVSSYPLRFKPIELNLEFPTNSKLELNLCKVDDVTFYSRPK